MDRVNFGVFRRFGVEGSTCRRGGLFPASTDLNMQVSGTKPRQIYFPRFSIV